MTALVDRLLELHAALDEHHIPHAFGGAIALAYLTLDPRGTSDLDVNIFLPSVDCAPALQALPSGIVQPADTAETVARDGQVRLWWDDTPLDLFFSYLPVHDDAAYDRRIVSLGGTEIPVLAAEQLVVFKAMFDRTKDWADIEAAIAADSVDLVEVRRYLTTMLGSEDPRLDRLVEAAKRARQSRFPDRLPSDGP